ncbi:MAG: hypothetical protein ACSLEN_04275 [Candidatus Malihini olakiniferum]
MGINLCLVVTRLLIGREGIDVKPLRVLAVPVLSLLEAAISAFSSCYSRCCGCVPTVQAMR